MDPCSTTESSLAITSPTSLPLADRLKRQLRAAAAEKRANPNGHGHLGTQKDGAQPATPAVNSQRKRKLIRVESVESVTEVSDDSDDEPLAMICKPAGKTEDKKRRTGPVPKTQHAPTSSVAGKGKGKGKLGMVLPYTDPTFSATDLALVSPLTRPFYHDCDDYDLCRRLMVDQNIGIDELKRKIHRAYQTLYDLAHPHHAINLYGRGGSNLYAAKKITSDAGLKKALGYGDPYRELHGSDRAGNVCILVSRHEDDTLQNILVVPAVWPASLDTMRAAFTATRARGGGGGGDGLTTRVCECLAQLPQSHVPHIPNPAHIDDWQAQYREPPQHVSHLGRVECVKPSRNTIYVLPIGAELSGGTPSADADAGLAAELDGIMPGLCEYIAAYYDSTCEVKELPMYKVAVDLRQKPRRGDRTQVWAGAATLSGVDWRVKEKVAPHGQLSATDLLDDLRAMLVKSKFPTDAVAVLGVTMRDLYMGEGDDFTQGLAGGTLQCGCGVFSFFRYRAGHDGIPGSGRLSKAKAKAQLLARANKTAVHELGHMFGIGHCVHRLCCMNGSGHLREDFAIPEHLCPVDLAKFRAVLGAGFEPLRRYCKLLKYYRARRGFAEQAKWTAATLRMLQQRDPEHFKAGIAAHLAALEIEL